MKISYNSKYFSYIAGPPAERKSHLISASTRVVVTGQMQAAIVPTQNELGDQYRTPLRMTPVRFKPLKRTADETYSVIICHVKKATLLNLWLKIMRPCKVPITSHQSFFFSGLLKGANVRVNQEVILG